MQNLEPQKLIEASRLFRNLQPHETAAVIARLQLTSYQRSAHIIERGVWNGQLYIIASGRVSILLQEGVGNQFLPRGEEDEETGREKLRSYEVAQLGPGECFGEMSLITGELPTATVRAERDTMLWTLTHMDFMALIQDCPALLQNINSILSFRLARTNRQLLSNNAQRVWLALVENSNGPLERSLAMHIADELAVRSHKRVLMLELCGQDSAVGPHFATHSGQVRASLLECVSDSSMIQTHRISTVTQDGRHYPALATLTGYPVGAQPSPGVEDLPLLLDADIRSTLADLAGLYDYLLLVTTCATPRTLMEAAAGQCLGSGQGEPKRAILLISASKIGGEQGDRKDIEQLLYTKQIPYSIFVVHVPGRPTIGAQDRYAAQLGHAVTRLLPADMPLLEQSWKQQATLSQIAPEAALTKAIDFAARYIACQTVGIAFGGGGARGFAHIGVLERLLHYSIPLDYIAGCSIGTIAPGLYLMGRSFDELEAVFQDIQHRIMRWNIPLISILSDKGLKHMLREHCGDLRFEDLITPFAMVAVDLTTQVGVVLDRGPLWKAALAAVSLPGIFPPVMVGEHSLLDAGIHDPVPISLVRKMGADILLASVLDGQKPPSVESATPWLAEAERHPHNRRRSQHIVDVLLRSYDIAMATISMHSIREADVVIRPKTQNISLLQFSKGHMLVAEGREAVEQSLPALRKQFPWLS